MEKSQGVNFFTLGITHRGHAHFGPWENLSENMKFVYRSNIGMLVHYTGVCWPEKSNAGIQVTIRPSWKSFSAIFGHFRLHPFRTVGKFKRKCENRIFGHYRHVGTLHCVILTRESECRHPIYDSTFMEVIFGHFRHRPFPTVGKFEQKCEDRIIGQYIWPV